jgi:hypothetical protein
VALRHITVKHLWSWNFNCLIHDVLLSVSHDHFIGLSIHQIFDIRFQNSDIESSLSNEVFILHFLAFFRFHPSILQVLLDLLFELGMLYLVQLWVLLAQFQ